MESLGLFLQLVVIPATYAGSTSALLLPSCQLPEAGRWHSNAPRQGSAVLSSFGADPARGGQAGSGRHMRLGGRARSELGETPDVLVPRLPTDPDAYRHGHSSSYAPKPRTLKMIGMISGGGRLLPLTPPLLHLSPEAPKMQFFFYTFVCSETFQEIIRIKNNATVRYCKAPQRPVSTWIKGCMYVDYWVRQHPLQARRLQTSRRVSLVTACRREWSVWVLTVILAAVGVIMVGYLAVGFAGYLAYPTSVDSNVLKSFPTSPLLLKVLPPAGPHLPCPVGPLPLPPDIITGA